MSKNVLAVSIIAALTVLLIYLINLYAIQLSHQKAQNNYWEQETKYATGSASLVCPPSIDEKPIPPSSCKRQDNYIHDRLLKNADHKAQVSMRNAAWGGLVIGIGGLILLWWTLNATLSAATSAADTLVQAKRAAESDRAWIVLNSITQGTANIDGKLFITFTVSWENAGKTPAVRYKCIVTSHVSDSIEDACLFIEGLPRPHALPEGIIGPTKTGNSASALMLPIEQTEVIKSEKVAVLFSEVEYRDINHPNIVRTTSIWQKSQSTGL